VSTQWRCAVCEAVNEGGDTCAACGAKVTRTVVQAPRPDPPPAPERTPAPRERPRDDDGTEVPVRELPRRRLEPDQPDDGPYDIYDLLGLDPAAGSDADVPYGGYEPVDVRPRVRVYGCCLPIALGILLALLAAVTLLASLLLGAL
jgi:hypothetical protein